MTEMNSKIHPEISLGGFKVGPNSPPLIVAELSGNHQGSLERALQLVEAAKLAGVHAIKLQTYTADTITLNVPHKDFFIAHADSLWKGKHLHELYQEAYTPWEWHKSIFERCKALGMLVFSSPFDETAVDFLESLEAPCYKIASPEIVDLPLIRKAAATAKPLIMSVGGASLAEIDDAVRAARQGGCAELILLKCTSAYPAQAVDCHLRTLPHLAACFDVLVGLSDHTLSLGVPIASVAFGCCLIEKHFTLSRQAGGVDSAFSLEPHEFKALVEESRKAWEALGQVKYGPQPAEQATISYRPSLYFVMDLPEGEVISPEHIKSLRPGKGLPPKEWDKVMGLKLSKPVSRGTPLSWDLFK